MAADPDLRWQTLLHQSRNPIFLLNWRRRFLFVNQAWEALTGVSQAEARQLICQRRDPVSSMTADEKVRSVCCPTAEVFGGASDRERRLWPGGAGGSRWWEIDFVPFQDQDGRICVLGRIVEQPEDILSLSGTLVELHATLAGKLKGAQPTLNWKPESLAALRDKVSRRHRIESLCSSLPAVHRAAEQARLAARNRLPVFVQGEAGTGKQWLARAIHSVSAERERVFLALDCERIPAGALAEVLNAVLAPGSRLAVGTVCLREPQFLPRELQSRVLEMVRSEALPADPSAECPRLIAASRFPPADSIAAGRLMEQLYHALAVQVIELAPLRKRRSDLPVIVDRCLERINAEGEKRITGLTESAWNCLRSYAWPGNWGELTAVLAEARRHAAGAEIDLPDLPSVLRLAIGMGRPQAPTEESSLPLEHLLEEAERRIILLALSRAGGNKTRAAEILSIFRPRLLRRMEALGIADPLGITQEG
jgi:transcriptional regulator of acetoin/glycerol metabolism